MMYGREEEFNDTWRRGLRMTHMYRRGSMNPESEGELKGHR